MKSWRDDGPDSVFEEMILNAESSPERFSQRAFKNFGRDMACGVCHPPIGPWEPYFLTCSIEDEGPYFIYQHMICPRSDS